jgi:hypothetical protein
MVLGYLHWMGIRLVRAIVRGGVGCYFVSVQENKRNSVTLELYSKRALTQEMECGGIGAVLTMINIELR